jgi:predicted transcriptional regulator
MGDSIAQRILDKEERIKNLEKMRHKYEGQGRTVNADRCTSRITEIMEDIIDLKAIQEDMSETK